MRVAIVTVEAVCEDSKLTDDDINVAGEYAVNLYDEVGDEQIADAALDVFHANVPVKVLEDFTFTVTYDGAEVNLSGLHQSYDLKHLGFIQE